MGVMLGLPVLLRACIVALAMSTAASAAQALEFDWPDLIDMSAQDFEDPYRDMRYDQIDDVRTVLLQRNVLESGGLSAEDRAEAQTKLDDAIARLAAEGLDPDFLISQRWEVAERRERAATAGNPALDGQTVTLAGFALAAPPASDGNPVVYLVPERGMCSHLPPPNPNQMIRVRLTGDWFPQYAHEPVRLTGKLMIEPTQEVFHVVDGPVDMRATFLMAASKVETIEDIRAQGNAEATREWAQQMAERLRASGVTLHSGTRQSE